jgi:catechol 2,3-dioxygenase-like lactoylglutathione lyase family enzyme
MGMALDIEKLKKLTPPPGIPFRIQRLGHVVVHVSNLERSVEFYTQVLGFKISDIYPEDMHPGGFAFLRCNTDHHCIALIGNATGPAKQAELNHIAFEVGTVEEVFRVRDRLRAHDVPMVFEGRRRAGCQVSVEFTDPDGHMIEVYWGIDQIGSDGRARPASEWRGMKGLEEAVANPVAGQDMHVQR